jgi:protein-S-isoprenylcysteine O-methyltransferase Ste14
MYIGELALWLGWALLFGSPAVLAGGLVLLVLMNRVIRREEAALDAQFGDAYRAYQATVPRWLRASTRTE